MFCVDGGEQEGCVVSNTIWSGGRVVAIELHIGPVGTLSPSCLQGVQFFLHVPIANEMGCHSPDMMRPSWQRGSLFHCCTSEHFVCSANMPSKI